MYYNLSALGIYTRAQYALDGSGKFAVVREEGAEVPWVSVDPESPVSCERHPQYSRATRWEVTVRAGEVLYLPSLWYHHVRQAHGTIAGMEPQCTDSDTAHTCICVYASYTQYSACVCVCTYTSISEAVLMCICMRKTCWPL